MIRLLGTASTQPLVPDIAGLTAKVLLAMEGHSTERDFIYVTTAHPTHVQLQQLSDEVGPERSLLVLCTAFRAKADRYPSLTVKKIPKQVLSRCEWGHDDYSLRIKNLPQKPPERRQQALDLEWRESTRWTSPRSKALSPKKSRSRWNSRVSSALR